jgi:signal transduction histidine kinase
MLVERARKCGQLVELNVDGEPGPLPASVELAAYRIVEEALAEGDGWGGNQDVFQILLEFREHDLLVLLADPRARATSPTVSMRERVAACHGNLTESRSPGGGRELRITLPTDYMAAFA